MEKLSETWIVDGTIDFELKKYTLLSYLQRVTAYFNEKKIFPQLSDLIFHHNNLTSFKENKNFLREQFPKQLTGIQIEKLELMYKEMMTDDQLMEEIEQIIHYATSKIKNVISNGSEIYDLVETKLSISPVGLLPIQNDEGYFFLSDGYYKATRVYYYRLTLFERHNEKYRSLSSSYVAEWQRNYINSYENIKANLIKQKKELPNPAVYSIETDLSFPLEETLLPVAKRTLVRYISIQ